MDFKTYLATQAQKIDQQLEVYYQLWQKQSIGISPLLLPLINITIEANKGGKRLRGTLVDLGYRLVKDQDNEEILKPAAAYEIFQTAILAHDDIMDKSQLRRGEPTIFKKLGFDHYATSQTISIGDIGFFQAIEILASCNFPAESKALATQSFTKSMTETGLGQMLDIEVSLKDHPKTEEAALTIAHLKTARYTIVGPLQLGAILAGANPKILQQLKDLGDSLGVAYQIHDDILGVFGDEESLGKSITSDIEEGKNTLLISQALKLANSGQKAYLDQYYGRGKIDMDQFAKIKQIFLDTGALKYSQEKSQDLVKQSQQIISEMEIKNDYKDLLLQMSEFIIARNK